MLSWSRTFAALYDPFVWVAEVAGMRTLRREVLSGARTLSEARVAAKSKDANEQFERLCALNFFAGEWAYLAGDKDAARAALQAALDTRAYWMLEFAAAKARLANMGG